MKPKIFFLRFVFLVMLFPANSCRKEEKIVVPVIETININGISDSSAVTGGKIIKDGGGPIIVKGVCWSTKINPTILDHKTEDGEGANSFISTIKELNCGTEYYVRAYATNVAGTGYGMTVSFKTLGEVPLAVTHEATNVYASSATLNATINPNYLSTVVKFEFGPDPDYGNEITVSQSPVSGGSDMNVSADITGLNPFTTYHFRVLSTNELGTTIGEDLSFTTLVGDIDGNSYDAIRIGTQFWMAENLKTTRYRNGTVIPYVTKSSIWAELTSGAFCWYNNNKASYKDTFGALYNWYAVNTGNLCPSGWHIPSDAEWETLKNYLTDNGFGFGGSGNDIAGSMAAATGWKTSGIPGTPGYNQPGNNSSGFSALPGGRRNTYGEFVYIGSSAYWWSATQASGTSAYRQHMNYDSINVERNSNLKDVGASIRCVKD